MRKELAVASVKQPVLFLDDWPQPPMGYEEEQEKPGMTDVKKWRLQMLLAVNPWGIPSLAFADAYKKMFHRELDVIDLGFEHLFDMVFKLKDVFAIQEPDEVTALMFPDYSHDKILHDARVGHNFELAYGDETHDYKGSDPDSLNAFAWINRDDNFPSDVVLAGDQYGDLILPMTPANIPGTRGIHQAVIVGAANPESVYINIKSDFTNRVTSLSAEVSLYFKESSLPIDMYSVPDEFIYKGFPCLVYIEEQKCWERAEIIGRSPKRNEILVETVDFGGVHNVNQICLFLMPKKFFDFPKQGVRVSMIGTKLSNGITKWPKNTSVRIRNFSHTEYYLDCLLLDPPKDPQLSSKNSTVSGDCESVDTNPSQPPRRKKKWQRKIQFEVIICDRNDDDMDIYLDEILLMETYAMPDETRSKEVETLRQQLKKALSNIPRPKNPL